jgi:hypothetical protein
MESDAAKKNIEKIESKAGRDTIVSYHRRWSPAMADKISKAQQ